MKKVLLSMLFLATMNMSAQDTEFESPYSKGSFTVGGGFSLSSSENNSVDGDSYESKGYSITPSVGYFIEDNLVIGVNGTYNNLKTEEDENGVNSTRDYANYSIGAYAEKYYNIYKRFFFNISGDFRYANNDDEENDLKNSFYIVGVSPGISCVINKHMSIKVGFENIIGYTYRTYENTGGEGSSYGLKTNLGDSDLSVGFRYFF